MPNALDPLANALLHFLKLFVERVDGVAEISPTLRTDGTLKTVAERLEKHRTLRDGYARAVRVADMLDGLEQLVDEADRKKPADAHVEKVVRWARSRGLELSNKDVWQIFTGKFPRGTKTGGPRDRLTARLSVVAGVSQSQLEKIRRARDGQIDDQLGISDPDTFERAFHDAYPSRARMTLHALFLLGYRPEQVRAALVALGYQVSAVDVALDRLLGENDDE